MLSCRPLLLSTLCALLFQTCTADIAFSSPAAGAKISGSTIDVEFEDGPDSPPLSDFSTYQLQLCAGGQTEKDFTILLTFTTTGDFATDGNSYSAKITNLNLGANTQNAYFLRTIGAAPGGVVYNYSPRFSLTSMTGTFPANVQSALSSISGTDGPPTLNQITNPAAGAGAGAAAGAPAGSYSIPYTMQTGPVRYAPMAKVAPSKITAKGNARQYPTSGYNVWSRTGMPGPNASQTVTDVFTFAVSSMEPTIAAAPQPSDDMQKFLNRWKD
ncbi:Cell wall synthesis protein kre9 precursor [Lithohypha guttulata]|nr:Cell wall synthesis protein kre9 precursor [Lithohypha guttulata]